MQDSALKRRYTDECYEPEMTKENSSVSNEASRVCSVWRLFTVAAKIAYTLCALGSQSALDFFLCVRCRLLPIPIKTSNIGAYSKQSKNRRTLLNMTQSHHPPQGPANEKLAYVVHQHQRRRHIERMVRESSVVQMGGTFAMSEWAHTVRMKLRFTCKSRIGR